MARGDDFQGLIFGPLLWNLGNDWVLRDAAGAFPAEVRLLCYANDTLIVAQEGGGEWKVVVHLAMENTALLVRRIEMFDLKVVADKTNAGCSMALSTVRSLGHASL